MNRKMRCIVLVCCFSGVISVPVAASDVYGDTERLLASGQSVQAVALLESHLSNSPDDRDGRFLLGVALAESGNSQRAIDVFSKLVKDHPQLPEPYNNLAVLYAQQGDYAAARESLELAIRTHPSYSTAHENLGDVYGYMAQQAYDRALKLDKQREVLQVKLNILHRLSAVTMPGDESVAAPGMPESVQVAAAADLNVLPAVDSPASESEISLAEVVVPEDANETVPRDEDFEELVLADLDPAISVVPAAEPEVVATTASAPEATPDVVVDQGRPNGVTHKAAISAVQDWAKAWSSQNVDSYLAAYADSFRPSGGLNRREWVAQRRVRLKKPSYIKVEVSDPSVQLLADDLAMVTFFQKYDANNYADESAKVLLLQLVGAKWLIVREDSIDE